MSEKPLPAGWKRSSLISLAEYHNGAAFKPKHWGEDGLPIIRIEQINDPNAPTDYYDGPLIPQNRIANGDLIFSWSATLKAVLWQHGEGALNQHLFKVVPRAGTNKEFLFHVLDYHMERIASGSHGSTMQHITRKELQRYQVELPEKESQQARIAEILSTVDAARGQTEALIAKYQQLKAGLMHDLFTRGVTPDGQLRPSRAQAPQLHKEDPILGWIPKDWDATTLGEISNSMTNGFVGTATPFYSDDEDAVQYLYGNNVRADKLELPTALRVTRSFHQSQRKSQLQPGDMLTVQSGHIGTSAVVPRDLGEANCHALIITKFKPNRVVPEFVSYYCNSSGGFQRLGSIFVGSTIKHINVKEFKHFAIPLPRNLAEQEEICARLVCATNRIDSEAEQLTKLRMQKQGLMQDLLTGSVRVKLNEKK